MPLHSDTTAAISDSVTTNLDSLSLLLSSCLDAMSASNSFSLSRNTAACSKSCAVMAASFSLRTRRSSSSKAFTSGVAVKTAIRILEAASSITSIALSGKNRSAI